MIGIVLAVRCWKCFDWINTLPYTVRTMLLQHFCRPNHKDQTGEVICSKSNSQKISLVGVSCITLSRPAMPLLAAVVMKDWRETVNSRILLGASISASDMHAQTST